MNLESGDELSSDRLFGSPTQMMLASGAMLGPYRLEAKLGAGGMGGSLPGFRHSPASHAVRLKSGSSSISQSRWPTRSMRHTAMALCTGISSLRTSSSPSVGRRKSWTSDWLRSAAVRTAKPLPCSPKQVSPWVRSRTCRPSRLVGSHSIREPTCSHSARSFMRWQQGHVLSKATRGCGADTMGRRFNPWPWFLSRTARVIRRRTS